MHAIATERVDLIQEMIHDKPQVSAEKRRDILEEEDRWTPERDIREGSIKQLNSSLKTVGCDEPIENGEEDAREAPADEVTDRSSKSPRRSSRRMKKRSDRLVNMYKMDGTTTCTIEVAGAQKSISLRRR